MAEHHDLVDRANKLMRGEGRALSRRRSFLAAPGKPPAPVNAAVSAEPSPADEDLPVLTEVVAADELAPPADAAPPDAAAVHAAPDEQALSQLAAELAGSLEQQLAAELPTLIEATLLNAQSELLAGVHATLDLALRNFLASRQLPPPREPDSELDADV